MTREEFSQLRTRFEALLAEPAERRAALLADIFQSNPILADELGRMLTTYASRTGWIDHPAADTILGAPVAPGAVRRLSPGEGAWPRRHGCRSWSHSGRRQLRKARRQQDSSPRGEKGIGAKNRRLLLRARRGRGRRDGPLYRVRSQSSDSTVDTQIWISKSRGLPLKRINDVDVSGGDRGKNHTEIHYEYTNVTAPAVSEPRRK